MSHDDRAAAGVNKEADKNDQGNATKDDMNQLHSSSTDLDKQAPIQSLTTIDDDSAAAPSSSSLRAHYPSDETRNSLENNQEQDEKVNEVDATTQKNMTTDNEPAARNNQDEQSKNDVSQQQQEKRNEARRRYQDGAPSCLLDCRDRIEACSHGVQAWADKQDLKARQRQERMQEQRDGGVRIDADGQIIEPKGDNIVQRKGIVVLVAIILSWVYIAFIWRICILGIQQKRNATTSRPEGIGLLVAFHILWLMSIWSYIRVVLAKPGFVRDHYSISDPPSTPTPPSHDQFAQMYHDYLASSTQQSGLVGADTEKHSAMGHAMPLPNDTTLAAPPAVRAEIGASDSVDSKLAAALGPVGISLIARANESQAQTYEQNGTIAAATTADTGVQVHDTHGDVARSQNNGQEPHHPLPEPMRLPQTLAPLHPSSTYCYRCKRVKPPRSHHCRHCGTCVLKMDHHCPWVGGCVGAGNHKFFFHFLQWVTMLEMFVLITTAIKFHRGVRRLGSDQGWTVDGYMISLFPLSAMFTMFTLALLITHAYMFVMNITTIEHMAYERQKTRENILIERWTEERNARQGKSKATFIQQVRERNAIRKRWAAFWGSPKSEANIWWLDGQRPTRLMGSEGEVRDDGDAKHVPRLMPGESSSDVKRKLQWYHAIGANWRQAMGENVLGWFLPIGRALNANGLTFEANWRFGSFGEWTPREQWPTRLKQQSPSACPSSAPAAPAQAHINSTNELPRRDDR